MLSHLASHLFGAFPVLWGKKAISLAEPDKFGFFFY
jgi:hypothetical protein